MLDDPKIKSLYQVKIGYSKCLDDYTDYARPLSRLCGEVMGSGSWVFQISTYRSSSFAAHGRELHLHLLPPRIVTLHWVMVHWVIHGHPLKLRGTSVSCSRNSELLWFFMKSTKSVFPDAKKHGAVKKDEALPHDNHDISKKKKYVQTMFKQCLNQGTQSLTMPVSNFFKFTCRSEHMMSMEQDRNGSKWITLRFYLRDTRGSKTYCNILPLRQQKSAKISKNQQNLHPSTSASC